MNRLIPYTSEYITNEHMHTEYVPPNDDYGTLNRLSSAKDIPLHHVSNYSVAIRVEFLGYS